MKLRIKGNLLRFRLGKSEVQAFGAKGRVEEKVVFGLPGHNDLCYLIEKSANDRFSASFANGVITVRIPEALVDAWVGSDQIGIEGRQTDEQADLRFLIEKDFVCLSDHESEDKSDKYPHPNGEAAC